MPKIWVIFLLSLAFILGLEALRWDKRDARGYFQPWDSNLMMHGMPIKQLKETPIQTIFYTHKTPPGFNIIRAIVVSWTPDPNPQDPKDEGLLYRVDLQLYFLWALIYAGIACLVFLWMKHWTAPTFAWIAWALWIIHPSPIFYAVHLDTTILSSLLTVWLCYEHWLLYIKSPKASPIKIGIIITVLALTRAAFQWYAVVLCFAATWFIGLTPKQKKQWAISLLLPLLLVAPWLISRKVMFNTFSTTTFEGYHNAGVIWVNDLIPEFQPLFEEAIQSTSLDYPENADRYSAGDKWNTKKVALDNLIWSKVAKKVFWRDPLHGLWLMGKSAKYNSFHPDAYNPYHFWRPSFHFTENRLSQDLPWWNLYSFVFSDMKLPAMLFLSVGFLLFLQRKELSTLRAWVRLLALVAMPCFTIAVCHLANRLHWSESNRLKFFVEPLFYVVIFRAFYYVITLRKRGNQSV